MFLHLFISHSVHRGGVWADTPLGKHPPWAAPFPQTATAAGGTHPTGMHENENNWTE